MNNKNILVGAVAVLVLVVLLVGVFSFKKQSSRSLSGQTLNNKKEASKETENLDKQSSQSLKKGLEKTYTLEDIAKHNSKGDCWFAINGMVYDVTSFISSAKHPGGEAILQGCGKDATTLFETRPMGSGTPHSQKARDNLAKFKIGVLKP